MRIRYLVVGVRAGMLCTLGSRQRLRSDAPTFPGALFRTRRFHIASIRGHGTSQASVDEAQSPTRAGLSSDGRGWDRISDLSRSLKSAPAAGRPLPDRRTGEGEVRDRGPRATA